VAARRATGRAARRSLLLLLLLVVVLACTQSLARSRLINDAPDDIAVLPL